MIKCRSKLPHLQLKESYSSNSRYSRKMSRENVTDEREPPDIERNEPAKFPDGGLRAWLVVVGAFFGLFTSFGWTNCEQHTILDKLTLIPPNHQALAYFKHTIKPISSKPCPPAPCPGFPGYLCS